MTSTNQDDQDWQKKLTPEQYRVMRQKGTEAPFSGALLHNNEAGTYQCAACGAELFPSGAKYDSTTPGLIGWPSFSDALPDAVEFQTDDSWLGMRRTEVTCAQCGSHLGHFFPDDKAPEGKHYCINSICLNFKPQKGVK